VIDRPRLLILLAACGVPPLIAGWAPPPPIAPTSPAAGATDGNAPTLVWKTRGAEGAGAAVEVSGADPRALAVLRKAGMNPDRWALFLSVRVIRGGRAGSQDTETPPLLGSYHLEGDLIRFVPRFPMEPGIRYRAEFDPGRLHALAQTMSPPGGLGGREPASATRLVAEFSIPERPGDPETSVVEVYPTRAALPENLLRFYIHFSAPMSRGAAYDHIRLLDAAGRQVDAPFLELDEELWSKDGMRFTLLFDPGRIKRGLKPREEVGPVLEAGKSYELVVDRGWTDARGRPLRSGFRKAFRAGPPDEISPDPKSWVIRPPRSQTREPLEARFPEPLDRALLDRLIAVQDASGQVVPGQVSVTGEETIWRWTPSRPWRPGDYRLAIGTELEDVAGNSIARPFEVDLAGPISRRITAETVALPFRIGAAPP
jgi:hypothetical protein